MEKGRADGKAKRAALRLDCRRRHLPDLARSGWAARHPRRSDRAARNRVRVVPRDDLLRDRAQHFSLRPDRTIRRGGDGPVRAAPNNARGAGLHCGGSRADAADDAVLAADHAVGSGGRHRQRSHRLGARGDRSGALVRRPARAGHRRVDGEHRNRPADLSAGIGEPCRKLRLAHGVADRGRGRAGANSGRGFADARPAARHGARALRCGRQSSACPRSLAATRRRPRCSRCATGCGHAISGCSPAAFSSAALRPTA